MKYPKLLFTALLAGALTAAALAAPPVRQGTTPENTPKIEELPRRPMDTIPTTDPETKVIIFSNNTWEFYRPDMSRISQAPVYMTHWDTTTVFAYRSVQLADLPEVIDLRLVDDMDQFCIPLQGRIFSKYGPRSRTRNHNGVDVPLKVGEPILAAFDGKVRFSAYNKGGFGNLIILRHPNGLETWYAHLSKRNVTANEFVKAGQVIGYGGNTGRSGGPHLHFEVRYKDQTFDPEFLFDFENGQLRYKTFALERSYFNIHSRASEMLDEGEGDYDIAAGALLAAADDSTLVRAAQPRPAAQAATAQGNTGPVYHTVRSGDMLSKLAVRYGTTVDKICKLNNISREAILRLGQKLRVK